MKKTLLLIVTILMSLTFVGCQRNVTDKTVTVSINNNPETVVYTGLLNGKIAEGNATCTSVDGLWSYQGTFLNGAVQNGKLNNYPMTIQYQDLDITGIYTGDLTDGKLNGKGKFVSEESDFSFDGSWKDGTIDNGQLEYGNYMVDLGYANRYGKYTGNIENGLANGDGVFETTNDAGTDYTYDGEWTDGIFDGFGVLEYDIEDGWYEYGTFSNGEFKPTPSDFLITISLNSEQDRAVNFGCSDSAYDFALEHEDLFTNSNTEKLDSFVNEDFSLDKFMKKPESWGDGLIKLNNYRIVQIWEYEDEIIGDTVSEMIVEKKDGSEVYWVIYMDETPELYEGDKATIYGLPVSTSSYESVDGGYINCAVVFASFIDY